jgi:hypothetical protein
MLNTKGDIINEFYVRTRGDSSISYYTEDMANDWFIQGLRWAAAYRKWPMTEGRISTTFASLSTDEDGILVGEYPEGWKSDSIRILRIGGKRLDKKNYQQFLQFLEDNPDSEDRIYSDFGRRYYINPSIDLSGTVTAWGQYTPYVDVTDTTAKTPFSDSEEEGNMAIVEAMIGFAYASERKADLARTHFETAKGLLDGMWENIKDEQYGYQTTDNDGMFKRIDVLGGALRDDLFKRDQFY